MYDEYQYNGMSQVSLSDLRGKVVVVNFWASWCNPCRKEFPLFADARAKYAKQGLEIIGVSYNDIASDSRAFVTNQGADWTFVGAAHFLDILLARDFGLTSPLSFWSTLVVTIGLFVANMVAGNSPSLGLDLQGGASVTLTPKGTFTDTAIGVATGTINAQEAFIKGRILLTGNQQHLMDSVPVFKALDSVFNTVRQRTNYE